MPKNSFFSGLLTGYARFVWGEGAGSPVEYSIFMGLVIGGALFGSQLLGVTVQKAMAQAAKPLGGKVEQAELPAHSAQSLAKTPTATPASADSSTDWLLWLQFGVGGVVLLGGGIAWYFLYARRVEKEVKEDEEQTAAEMQMRDKLFAKRQTILKFLSADMQSIAKSTMAVKHLMSQKLTVIRPDMPFEEVKTMMVEGRRHHLLVTDDQNQLLGVISDRDVFKKKAANAAELMTPNPCTVSSSTLVGPAITLILDRNISCLPVVENEKLVGVLTKSDLLMALQCTLQILNTIAQGTTPAPRKEPTPVAAECN